MRSRFTGLIAVALGASFFVACALGRSDMERWTLAGSGGGGSGGGGASEAGSGGDGAASGQGPGADDGGSGQGSGGDDGAYDNDAASDDAGDSDSDSDSGSDSGAAGSSGSGGTSGSGGGGGISGSGGGGTTNGLSDCTQDAVQSRGEHDYYFCSNYMSWPFARDICADGGGSLVVIDDAEENDFLTAHFGPHPSWWIGANDETTPDEWRWVDGAHNDGASLCTGNNLCSPAGGAYVNFAFGEPNAISSESCAAIQSAGTWADEYCVVSKPFVCELAAP